MRYRLCWSASTDIGFRGETEWEDWDGDEKTVAQVEDALNQHSGQFPDGLDMVLNASGFEWWAEVKDA